MTAEYETIRPQLDTGDLVLFSGRGLVSSVIKLFTRSQWSHVGMILRPCPGLVSIWESTTLAPVSEGPGRPGVQVTSLSDRLAAYDGRVAIRRLEGFERSAVVLERLLDLRQALNGRPYESSTLQLLGSEWSGLVNFGADALASLFCSELVAEAYKTLGLLDPEIAASHYVPEDFAFRYITLLGGASLADEVTVKGEP